MLFSIGQNTFVGFSLKPTKALPVGEGYHSDVSFDGKVDEAGTKSVTLEENKKDVPFFFSFLPHGGWPGGAHEVALTMNGKEVVREKFSVKPAPEMKAAKLAVTKTLFHANDGKDGPGEVTASFGTNDQVFHVEFLLANPALAKGSRVAWILVEAADAKNEEIAVATIEEEGVQKVLTSSLRTKKGLPAGSYRVELREGDAVIAKESFEVMPPSGDAPTGGGLKPKK